MYLLKNVKFYLEIEAKTHKKKLDKYNNRL